VVVEASEGAVLRAHSDGALKRLLLTGAGGLLGRSLARTACQAYEVIAAYHTSPPAGSLRLDVVERGQVGKAISQTRPDIVVHCAAQTDVDRCEVERDLAMRVNAEGTRNVAEGASRAQAKLVYISTDYVFDGEEGWYTEEHATNPVNTYGLSKLKGEEHVRKLCGDHVIIRSSVIFGWHPRRNFATWVIRSLREGREIDVVVDHYNTPTFAPDLARGVLGTLADGAVGTFHLAGRDRLSRYEFALRLAERFNLPQRLIRPVGMAELKGWIAKRPRDSSLNCEKAERRLRLRLQTLDESLDEMQRTEGRV